MAKRPTKTKDKTDFDFKVNDAPNEPVAIREPDSKDQSDNNISDPRYKTKSTPGTITPTDDMRDMMGRLQNIEELPGYDNEEDYDGVPVQTTPDVPVTTQNLPKIMSQELANTGYENPDWYQVSNLPGNMARAIRSLGNSLFGEYTSTATDDIYVVANLAGQGPNTNREVQSVAKWVSENGSPVDSQSIDFSQFMPGYEADVKLYDAAGIRWMLVKDFAGNYVYSWPAHESKGGAPKRIQK